MTRQVTLAVLALVVAAVGTGSPAVAAQPSPHATLAVDAGPPSPAGGAGAASGTSGANQMAESNEAESNEPTEPNETNGTPSPGAVLAGAVSAQGAELRGEISARSLDRALAAADTNAAKARVVAAQASRIESRLQRVEARMDELRRAHRNGTLSDGAFHARMVGLVARAEVLSRLANETAAAAYSLPDDALAEQGVNASAIYRLSTRAESLGGRETAEIARSVAGPPAGTSLGRTRDAAAAHRAEAAIERAEARIARAERLLSTAEARLADGSDALTAARADLERARELLDRARAALERGDTTNALALAAAANAHADDAAETLRRALGGPANGSGPGAPLPNATNVTTGSPPLGDAPAGGNGSSPLGNATNASTTGVAPTLTTTTSTTGSTTTGVLPNGTNDSSLLNGTTPTTSL